MAKCELCKAQDAIWALQYIGDPKPSFTFLGNHYRGFALKKLCDKCKERVGLYHEFQDHIYELTGAACNIATIRGVVEHDWMVDPQWDDENSYWTWIENTPRGEVAYKIASHLGLDVKEGETQ